MLILTKAYFDVINVYFDVINVLGIVDVALIYEGYFHTCIYVMYMLLHVDAMYIHALIHVEYMDCITIPTCRKL